MQEADAPRTTGSRTKTLVLGLALGLSAGFIAGGMTSGRDRPTPPPPPGIGTPEPGMEPGGAFDASMRRMHGAMDAPATGDVDLDFARGMVPHHQGAIDMARIELERGTDPAMRRLAQSIVTSQESEIAGMRKWMAQREGARR